MLGRARAAVAGAADASHHCRSNDSLASRASFTCVTPHSRMAFARTVRQTLFYETFGDPADPTLVLVNGLGSQCINYRVEWCERFVAKGFHVVRMDNRDVGLSTHFSDAPPNEAAYTLSDMAARRDRRARRARCRPRPRHGAVDGRDDRADARHRASGPPAVDDVGDVDDR